MVKGFWKEFKKPIIVLAPMADVTDAAFRRIIVKYGKPDALWTEFVSCDGLCSEGKSALMKALQFTSAERPIVAQFFGSKPDNFYRCAELAQELGFDGIDINMGCPDRNVEKQKAGAALMQNQKLAQKIIKETMRGAGDLPVSVKTRLGYNTDILETWMPQLLETGLSAITMHARTRKEMSLVPARWERIKRAVEIAHNLDSSENRTLIFGNGDIANLADAKEKIKQTGADGAMIGRGIFGNPWFFNKEKSIEDISLEEKLSVMLEHTFLFEKLFLGVKNFDVMKKHYKAYVHGFEGAKELRIKLMNTHSADEVLQILKSYYPNVKGID